MGFGEIGSFEMGNLGPITGLNKLDTNALRRAGMTALADGDFAKAQQYGNEANNMLPDSTSLGFLSDFGFGDSATADNIATKAAATIGSQQPAQPAKVVASPVVRTILNTAQNPVYYSGYQGYTRPTYTTSYLVPTASATQYAAYY